MIPPPAALLALAGEGVKRDRTTGGKHRSCSRGHEQVNWFGEAGCWFCGGPGKPSGGIWTPSGARSQPVN